MPLRLNGATSGYVQLAAPAVAGSTSLVLPTDSVQPGLVLVATSSFTTASTVSVDGCFTATYDSYVITCYGTSSAGAFINYRMRAASSDDSTANYQQQTLAANSTTVAGARDAAQSSGKLGYFATTGGAFTATLYRPALAAATIMTSIPMHTPATPEMYDIRGAHNVATAYDGFSIIPASGTITGSLAVYGYRASITT